MSSGKRSRAAQEDPNVQDQNSWVLRTPDKLIPPRSTSVPVDMQKNHMRKDSWPELLRIYSEILNHNEEDQISDPTSSLLLNGGVPAETNENADLYVQNLSHGDAGSSNSSSVREVVGQTTTDMVASSVSHSRTNTNSCSQTTSNRMEPKSDHLMLATQCSPSYSNQRLPVSNRYTQEGSNRVSSESTALMLQKQNFHYSSNRMPNSLRTQVGNNRNEPDINNLQLLKHDHHSSFNQTHTESSSFQSTVDGYPVSYWPDHNINSPPRPVSNAELCASASFHFAPVTPDKGNHLERQAPSERSGVLLDECSGQEMDKQRNVVTSTSGRTKNRPSEFSQIIADSTTTGLLTPLKEDNLDEIGEQGLDSHKTPDPKTTKKRKHRPKVVKEGTPKSAQKPATPKTKVSDVSSTGERKYFCKKHIKSPESQQDLVGNEGKVPAVKSSVKACRALNFDLASAARDASQEITDSHQAAKGPVNNEIPQHNDMAHQIDELICQLKGLSINSRRDIDEPELHALVTYEGFDKKHKPQRPKVQNDPEIDRIWNLLMRREEGETAEETDKGKWWEEREVFRGRAESFIYRMRLVQGNRRFSRWKGSVVDSVVGVFLTQNVSDHLSSSAFMSLAAIFPLQSAVEPVSFSGETRLNIEPGLGPKDYHDFGFTEKSLPPFRNTPTHLRITKIEGASLVKGLSGSMAEGKSPSQKNGMPTVEAPVLNQTTFSRNYPTHNGSVQPEHCAYSTNNNELDNSKNSDLERTAVKEPARPPKGETVRIHGQHRQKLLDNITEANANEQNNSSVTSLNETTTKFSHAKKGKAVKNKIDWDKLRKQAQSNGKRERSKETMDSLDYEAMRCSDVNKIANAIKERGLNNKLAERIKDFLNRLVDDHGSIDLEWLRDAPPDKAKDYLRSFQGLGLKSVECIRLLTLHQIAFPVDTNVGRIAVRLGWVPLQPLPESIQLHLLEQYPVLESVQKYLWPRLCKLDQETLYELHYQMITFGKVFCTKNKPNCNACPLRGECRHFASAFASARLALPAPEEKSIVDSAVPFKADGDTVAAIKPVPLLEAVQDKNKDAGVNTRKNEPIVEEPSTPEHKITELEECDIEDALYENPDEIPTIKLNTEEFATNLQKYMQDMELQDDDVSRALVALNPQAASIPAPKLKNVSRLRTEHQVYELPDSHPLLEMMDKREPDDPSPYLLAIWTPGETADSVQPPEQRCESHESGQLCSDNTCFTCNSTRETNAQIVRGTVLIPCRTATRGSFPLNGTYFQVNEMFADHESSLNPIDVPRSLIWNLPRRTVYFGTSVTSIFRGLSMEAIQFCFWRGFVCVRGFDRKQTVPRPLMARLHFTTNRLAKNQE